VPLCIFTVIQEKAHYSVAFHFIFIFFLNINSHVFSNINGILLKYMGELLCGVKALPLLSGLMSGVNFDSAVSVRTVPLERVRSTGLR